jgi:hypothetical protein
MQNRHRFTGRKVCDLSFVFSERVQGGPALITCNAGEQAWRPRDTRTGYAPCQLRRDHIEEEV